MTSLPVSVGPKWSKNQIQQQNLPFKKFNFPELGEIKNKNLKRKLEGDLTKKQKLKNKD